MSVLEPTLLLLKPLLFAFLHILVHAGSRTHSITPFLFTLLSHQVEEMPPSQRGILFGICFFHAVLKV